MRRRVLAKNRRWSISKNQFQLMLRKSVYVGRIVIPAWQEDPEEEMQGLLEASGGGQRDPIDRR